MAEAVDGDQRVDLEEHDRPVVADRRRRSSSPTGRSRSPAPACRSSGRSRDGSAGDRRSSRWRAPGPTRATRPPRARGTPKPPGRPARPASSCPSGRCRAARDHVEQPRLDAGGGAGAPGGDRGEPVLAVDERVERRSAGRSTRRGRRRDRRRTRGRRRERGREQPREYGDERRDHRPEPTDRRLGDHVGPRLGVCSGLSRAYTHDRDDQFRRNPPHVPGVLRIPRASAAAVCLAGAGGLRPIGAVHRSGYASAQALLPGRRAAAAQPGDDLPDVVPDAGHRDHRDHHPASDAVRDARQLLVRRLLQARGRAVRLGAVDRRVRLPRRRHLDHGVRRRRRARPRARPGGDRRLAGDRRAA